MTVPRADVTVAEVGVTPRVLLEHILAAVGEPAAGGAGVAGGVDGGGGVRGDGVEFAGADPVLRTPLRIGEAGAATIAASGLMAARLWELRTGRRQSVRVEVDAAAAAMRSSRYLRVLSDQSQEAASPPGDFRPRAAQGGQSVFATRDGRWVYLHRTFPHHRDRINAVLGGDHGADAVNQWDALALEEAVYAAGACGVMVRSATEWHGLEQARAIAELPLLEILRVGEAPPAVFAADGIRPLDGIRALDLTRVLAGPICGRTLAEHGAHVLRVGTPRVPDDVSMMCDTGHGKRSTALELTSAGDADTLRKLIQGADVFVQGYRPGAIASLGFGPEELIKYRPGLVYVQLSAFSHRGPWSARRGFDSVVQAASGISEEHAGSDGTPGFTPANPLDYMTGYLAAFGIMVALGRRAREGGSYLVRLSLAQTGRWLASLPRIAAADVANTPADLPAERLDALMMTSETPFGRLRHLAPIAQLSETLPRWEQPSVPLAHNPPQWW